MQEYGSEDPTAGWCPFEPDRDAEYQQQEQLYLDATAKSMTSVAPVSVTATCFPARPCFRKRWRTPSLSGRVPAGQT